MNLTVLSTLVLRIYSQTDFPTDQQDDKETDSIISIFDMESIFSLEPINSFFISDISD